MRAKIKYFLLSLLLMLSVVVSGCGVASEAEEGFDDTTAAVEESIENQGGEISTEDAGSEAQQPDVVEDGVYTSKEEVAEYIHLFGHLPSNFITKKEAKSLGWISKEGNLSEVAPGKSIGGDYFGNYEGLLPEDKDYYECDIDSDGGYRGAKRIVYSEDGCIYYTEDHYESFELLYGEEQGMKVIELDAEKLNDRKESHIYLAKKLNLPEHYGRNLDALYDCLTEIDQTVILFENEEKGVVNYRRIRQVFEDAAEANDGLIIVEQEKSCCRDENHGSSFYEGKTIVAADAENNEITIDCDMIIMAVGSKKNVIDVEGVTAPITYVGDCSGERTASIAEAIRTGYNAGNEI